MSLFDAQATAPSTRSTLARTALEDLPPVSDILQLQEQINAWESEHHTSGFDSVGSLRRIAEILERAMEDYMQQNPDPLDDRHPSRTHPSASFGVMLKAIIRKENFMQTLIVSYVMARDNPPLAEAGCRVLLSCVPGLDSNTVFSDPEELIPCLYKYALNGGTETLKAYAFGLLASAMEVQNNAGKYKKENSELIPVALQNLKRMRDEMEEEGREEKDEDSNSNGEPSAAAAAAAGGSCRRTESPEETFPAAPESSTAILIDNPIPETSMRVRKRTMNGGEGGGGESPPRKKKRQLQPFSPPASADENSMSQWNVIKHVLIGTHKIYPLTPKMFQRLIIQYLGTIGEYQDMLVLAYEGNSMGLLFDYINLEFTDDIRLTLDALKYLCSLLVHRKFALEFVAKKGVEKLLKVPSTSLAAVGVATCFYYLAYGVDVMERVCQLEEKILDQVVEYMLWVQEHQHESGMSSATMFFTHALAFRAILDRFDARDGTRKLYNYMSTLTMLQHPSIDVDLTEEQVQTSAQTIRNTCCALRTYATSHLFIRIEQFRRANVERERRGMRAGGEGWHPTPYISTPRAPSVIPTTSQPPVDIPYYKPMHMEEETLRQAVWQLAGLHKGHYSSWKAMEELRSMGILRLLLSMLLRAHEWITTSSGRYEIAINAITVLTVAATIPRVQSDLCGQVSAEVEVSGLALIMSICDDKEYGDSEAPIAALVALVACTCAAIEVDGAAVGAANRKQLKEMQNGGGGSARRLYGHSSQLQLQQGGGSSSKHAAAAAELATEMVLTIRRNNGLMLLNTLIRTTTPITEADVIRALTCKVLVGMARDKEIRRILSLLPLISQNELHDLMREPVCPDKKAVHSQFCAEAKVLIATVMEKSLKDVKKDLTQERLWRSHIISSTQISYNERELLQLIHSHLVAKGLTGAAAALSSEASLEGVQQLQQPAAATAASVSAPPAAPTTPLPPPAAPAAAAAVMVNGIAAAAAATASTSTGLEALPCRNILTRPPAPSARAAALPREGLRVATPVGGRGGGGGGGGMKKTRDAGMTPFPRRLPIRPSGGARKPTMERREGRGKMMHLNDIVTEYFRVQHSYCTHPVSTCPPFSLYHPHRCPEPAQWRLPQNVTARLLHSSTFDGRARLQKASLDERFIFSRFRPSKIFQESEEHYTACTFSIDDEHVILGTFSGEIQWMNLESGLCEATAQCHHSAISGIAPSKDGSMLLTSGLYMNPQSTLWRLGDQQTHLMDFPEESAVNFNNASVQDRIVGTTNEKATVYDIETGRTLHTLQNVDKNGEYYAWSKASFSPYDDMILHDNTLYDLRSNKIVRVFDRMNKLTGGCFHPHGNEIIINSEVWDARSFSLLHSVPVLDQARITFNATGNIMLVGTHSPNTDPYKIHFGSALRTLSSRDYSVISTIDIRRPMMDFCFSHEDSELAVVEVVKSYTQEVYFDDRNDETVCRTYEIGKVRVPEDGDEDGEQEEEAGDGDDRDSDDDSDGDSDSDSSDESISSEEGEEGSERALELLGRLAGESSGEEQGSGEEEEEEEEGEEESSSSGSSSGWAVASNQEDGGEGEEVDVEGDGDENEDEEEEDEDEEEGSSESSNFMDDGSDEEDDREDPAFNPDTDERGGTSNIILNPNLRKRRGV